MFFLWKWLNIQNVHYGNFNKPFKRTINAFNPYVVGVVDIGELDEKCWIDE